MAGSGAATVGWLAVACAVGLSGAGCSEGPAEPLPSKQLTAQEEAEVAALALPITPRPWRGDLDGMRERRRVRVLVPHSRTLYFLDRGEQRGLEYEFAHALEDQLNQGRRSSEMKIHVVLLPVPRDRLIPGLVEGLGDVAAGVLTVTPERAKLVDFATPFATGIREVLVTGPGAPPISGLDGLSGQVVHVRSSSSYHEHLLALSEGFASRGLAPVELEPADESLEDEDLLAMVNAGILPWVVVDRFQGVFWSQLLPGLRVRDDVVIDEGGEIAWAIRQQSPLLAAELDRFASSHQLGTAFGNIVAKRYFRDTKFVTNSTAEARRKRFEELAGIFQRYSRQYGFDYLMMMAQGFQESELDQKRRSPRGAVAIMQLLPATAASKEVGIHGIDRDAERNVHAGVKYMRLLVDTYLDDPAIDEKNRVLLAFAGYNAGPGNLRKFRALAEKSGHDPNVWFGNVEIAAARIVGSETVQYVSNIFKYYVAYKLALERELARSQGLEDLRATQ